MKRTDKVWGYEVEMTNTPEYCMKRLYLNQGWRCSLHHHKIKDETFYIADGWVLMEVDGEEMMMQSGDYVRIKPGVKHRFSGLCVSIIIEASTHHEDSDSYRDEESGEIPEDVIIRLGI